MFILLQLSPFVPTSTQPLTPFPPAITTLTGIYGSCICVFWLIPSPYFIQSPFLHSLWQLSVCSICTCLCFYFVHYIPHMSEIIWCLCFTDWLLSLSIITPSPSTLLQKVKVPPFLLPCNILFYKCTTFFLFTISPNLFILIKHCPFLKIQAHVRGNLGSC